MKGNKIVIERYLEEGELVDSLDLSVNYLVKHTREGGMVPLPPINIITWSMVTDNPSPSDLMTVTNTNTSIDFDDVVAPSGYPYIYKIQGNLYTTIATRNSKAPNSIKYVVECSLPSATTIGSYAFRGCSNLTSVNMPNATYIAVDAFRSCTSLTSIDLPKVTEVGNNIFQSCTSLTSVNMPSVTTITGSMFNSCTSLTSVNIPNATTIGSDAFRSCTSLTSIDLPNATSIGGYAFVDTSLTSIDLPNVTSIGMYALSISSLTTMTIGINTNQVATLSLASIRPTIQFIYVPDALVNDYKSATNWSDFADKIKGISEKPTA